MILLLDNYDSFVHNLARYIAELGEDPVVRRNDKISIADVESMSPSHIVVSPGPCTPAEAGISVPLIQRFAGEIPILGVCLGHQAIGAAFGGKIVRAARPMHGRTSPITHAGDGLFAGLPSPMLATRYHSLVIERDSVPRELEVVAVAEDDGEIMAVRHRSSPVHGVQFHPESILSEHGYALIDRFLGRPGTVGVPANTRPDTLPSRSA